MNAEILQQVSRKVFQKFPEVRGSSPDIHAQGDNTLLIYSGIGKTPDGKNIQRIVRVVIDAKGKILKMTTSR